MKCVTTGRRGITLLEMLIAFTVLVMFFGAYEFFMSGQRREITTVTQRSEADSLMRNLFQQFGNDVRDMRRESFREEGLPNFSAIRYKKNDEAKQSDLLAVVGTRWTYDRNGRKVTRIVTPLKYDKGTFKPAGASAEQSWANVSQFEVTPVPMPKYESTAHKIAVGARMEVRLPNAMTGQDQIAIGQDQFTIRDEAAFRAQPHWNANAAYTSSFVDIQQGQPTWIDFDSALDIQNWAKAQIADLESTLANAQTDIQNDVMAKLASQLQARTEELRSKYATDGALQGLMRNVSGEFGGILASLHERDKPAWTQAGLFLQDKFAGPADSAKALKEQILGRTLSDDTIKQFLFRTGGNFPPYNGGWMGTNPTRELIEKFRRGDGSITTQDQNAFMGIISSVKNNLYGTIGTADAFTKTVDAYSHSVAKKLASEMKGEVMSWFPRGSIEGLVNDMAAKQTEKLKVELNIAQVLKDGRIDGLGRQLVGQLASQIESGMASKLAETRRKIVEIAYSDEGLKLGRGDVDYSNPSSIQAAYANAPSTLNSSLGTTATMLLAGMEHKTDAEQLTQKPGATNYIKNVYAAFGLPAPRM